MKHTCSRTTRRQLFTAELVAILCANADSLIGNLEEEIKKDPDKFYRPVQLTIKAVHEVIKYYSPNFPKHPFEKSEDPKSDFQKFIRYEAKLKKYLKDLFKESGLTLDYFDAVLALVEKAYISNIGTGSKVLYLHWENVSDNLLDFYELIDPNFERTSHMKLGTNLPERIEDLLNI